jgi:Tol biopolymer transport system component
VLYRAGNRMAGAGSLRLIVVAAVLVSCSTTESPFSPPGPPAYIFISPADMGLIVGRSDQFIANAHDANGRVRSAPFEWSSSDPTIVAIGKTDGRVTAIAKGTATVTVTSGSISASAQVTIVEMSGTLSFTRVDFNNGSYSSDVFSYSASDGALRPLPRDSRFQDIAAPTWSPDGALIALEGITGPMLYDPNSDMIAYPSDVFVANAAAPSLPWRALTNSGASRSPSWSPDGNRIAYVEGLPPSRSHIFIIHVSGGAPTRLTSAEGVYDTPRWSPDGARLAFANQGGVFIINADGTGLVRVSRSTAEWDWDPSWSPDGLQLAFVRSKNDIGNLMVARLADLDQPFSALVAAPRTWASAPVWSPDGRWIALSLNGEHDRGIYAVSVDGSAKVRLTKSADQDYDRPSAWTR